MNILDALQKSGIICKNYSNNISSCIKSEVDNSIIIIDGGVVIRRITLTTGDVFDMPYNLTIGDIISNNWEVYK